MNDHRLNEVIDFGAEGRGDRAFRAPHFSTFIFSADSNASAARTRLAAANQRRRRCKEISAYYGDRDQREEIIEGAGVADALVTRNHYGSLVLNSARALFIDVDFEPPGRMSRLMQALGGRRDDPWQHMYDDLCAVLSSECEEGFRLYRTAAGFRILATTHLFEPESLQSQRLMQAVSADAAFVRLCRTQRNFRARLTPKPWRCGATKPPGSFPRESAEDRRRFAQWLSHYERACRDRSTCRYLGHVGPNETHERVAPVVAVHDRMTKALEPLPLA